VRRNDVLHGQDIYMDASIYILWQNATCFIKQPGFCFKNTKQEIRNFRRERDAPEARSSLSSNPCKADLSDFF